MSLLIYLYGNFLTKRESWEAAGRGIDGEVTYWIAADKNDLLLFTMYVAVTCSPVFLFLFSFSRDNLCLVITVYLQHGKLVQYKIICSLFDLG